MKMIKEVCLIRLILIILLVIYHAFAPYCEAWTPIDSVHNYTSFWWIGKAAYSCMLECFTLISGWVFGYQYLKKGSKICSYKQLIQKKIKRLIIPSIIFSIVYILIFKPELFGEPKHLIYSSIEGYAHMWYLPMLFWCFLGIVFIEKSRIKPIYATILFIIMSVLSFLPLPLRLGSTMYYMVFFYGGFLIGSERIDIKKKCTLKAIVIFGIIYLIVFIFCQSFAYPILQTYKANSLESKIICSAILKLLQFVYSLSGVIAIVLASTYVIEKKQLYLNNRLVSFGTYTFGIYIFQQFILMWLYYHTDLIYKMPDLLIPWTAFIISLMISYMLSVLIRSNRLGRLLI